MFILLYFCTFIFYLESGVSPIISDISSKNNPTKEHHWWHRSLSFVHRAFKGQHKMGNIFAYKRSLITDDLKVLLSGNDITGGVTTGGSTAEGGGQKSGDEVDA